MQQSELIVATVLEGHCLTIEQLSLLCNVEPDWIVRHADEGLLPAVVDESNGWLFSQVALHRARRMAQIERDFDAVPELAALVADLQEELESLRRQLLYNGDRNTPKK